MKIYELSKELEVTNGEIITYLKDKGYKVSSHMANATDDMVSEASDYFKTLKKEIKEEVKDEEKSKTTKEVNKTVSTTSIKKFAPDDMITCRSVTPWKLETVGIDRTTVYHWEYFGDVDYVAYKDLQSMRRKDIVTKPKIIIEDPDLCLQWARELGEIYKPFLGVEYPEELFDMSDDDFEDLLKTTNDTVREVVKVTAMNMIKNENYPSVQKVKIIDKQLGTCIKEFL